MLSVLSTGVQEELHILLQAGVAVLLAGILGWERQAAGKGAGLRTHILVCLSAMLFIRLGLVLIAEGSSMFHGEVLRADPGRIIEAIVTGLAFLGAGTIFREPNKTTPNGLTTAASLLATAPIGIAIALDRYVVATGTTLLVLFVLRILQKVEERWGPPPSDDNPT